MQPGSRFLALMVTLVLVAAACGDDDGGAESGAEQTPEKQELESVKIGLPAMSGYYLPEIVALEEGFFEDEGLDVSIEIGRPPNLVAGALSGEIPYDGALPSAIQSAVAGGTELRVVFATFGDQLFDVYAAPDIGSLDQLVGDSIAVTSPNSSDHYLARQLLEAEGFDPDQFTFVGTGGSGDRWSSLQSGAVPAATLSPPFSQMAEREGYTLLLAAEGSPPTAGAGFAVTESYIEEHPEQIKSMIRAILRSMSFIRENQERTIEILEAELQIDPAVSEDVYDQLTAAMTANGHLDTEFIAGQAAAIVEATGSPSAVEAEDLTDFSLLDAVLDEENVGS